MKKINKIIIPLIGISSISIPAVLAISCGDETSQDPQKPTASTDEDLTIDAIEKENELKVQKANEINLLIDEVVSRASAPVLSNIGSSLTVNELSTNFSSTFFNVMDTVEIMGGDQNYSSIEAIPISLRVIDEATGKFEVTVQVSSTVELTKIATYTVEMTTSTLSTNAQSSSIQNQAVNDAKSAFNAAKLGLFEGTTKYMPTLNNGQPFSTISTYELSRSGSDFSVKSNSSGIRFQVNGVDTNPGVPGKISLNIYFSSEILKRESMHDNSTEWEGTFKIELNNSEFMSGGTHNDGSTHRAMNFNELPHDGTVWSHGIAYMAQGQSLSMVMDLATRLGWERPTDDSNGLTGSMTKIVNPSNQNEIKHNLLIDEMNAVEQITSVPDDNFLENYYHDFYVASDWNKEHLRYWLINTSTLSDDYIVSGYSNGVYVNNSEPFLMPGADYSRTDGSARPWIAAQSGGLNLASGFTNYSTSMAGSNGTKDTAIWDLPIDASAQIATYVNSEKPGVVFSDISIKDPVDNTKTIENIYESKSNFVRTYEEVPLIKKERYVLVLTSLFDKITNLISSTGSAVDSASRFIDEDLVSAIKYISSLSSTITRSEISNLFDEMNNGTYYWPAIEIFESGVTNVPVKYYDSNLPWGQRRNDPGTRTITGFQSLNNLAGLQAWFQMSKDPWLAFVDEESKIL